MTPAQQGRSHTCRCRTASTRSATSMRSDARGLFTGNRGIIHDPGDQDAAQEALDDEGLDHLQLRIQGHAARADGPQRTERQGRLDGAVLPRRGDGARRRAPALLPCRRERAKEFAACYGEPFGVAEPKAPRSTPDCTASGWRPAERSVELDRHGLKKLPDGAMIFDGKADPCACAAAWRCAGRSTAMASVGRTSTRSTQRDDCWHRHARHDDCRY